MLRKIVKPTNEIYNLRIPHEYINQQVEILVLPFTLPNTMEKQSVSMPKRSLAGALNQYANPSLIEREKEIAWQKVAESHK